ncbi:hypothetical protein [Falsarthrobacter nasiphocae]|uniref:Uncharacterized protein n=1 Tax=Falsarthrobacter nasiphocae TaxID=189863 RepID=A0AAE4C679_9MICC|nr:hypothetical protein [Falsarthrobacter nasiphocae]MDR6891219.1 hypothetical protein [Falsarthrobacter nasiphocae]
MSHSQPPTGEQPSPAGPPAAGRRGTSALKWGAAAALAVLLLVGAMLVTGNIAKGRAHASDAGAVQETIRLEATSRGGGHVTWTLGASSSSHDFTSRWSESFQRNGEVIMMKVTGDFGDPEAAVTCKIYVNDELKVSASGSGGQGLATCVYPNR